MKNSARRNWSIREVFIVIGMVMLFSLPGDAKASNKDVVVMTNGDRLIGEMKRLQNGMLYVKTDYMAENIGVDWAQVHTRKSVFAILPTRVHLYPSY